MTRSCNCFWFPVGNCDTKKLDVTIQSGNDQWTMKFGIPKEAISLKPNQRTN